MRERLCAGTPSSSCTHFFFTFQGLAAFISFYSVHILLCGVVARFLLPSGPFAGTAMVSISLSFCSTFYIHRTTDITLNRRLSHAPTSPLLSETRPPSFYISSLHGRVNAQTAGPPTVRLLLIPRLYMPTPRPTLPYTAAGRYMLLSTRARTSAVQYTVDGARG